MMRSSETWSSGHGIELWQRGTHFQSTDSITIATADTQTSLNLKELIKHNGQFKAGVITPVEIVSMSPTRGPAEHWCLTTQPQEQVWAIMWWSLLGNTVEVRVGDLEPWRSFCPRDGTECSCHVALTASRSHPVTPGGRTELVSSLIFTISKGFCFLQTFLSSLSSPGKLNLCKSNCHRFQSSSAPHPLSAAVQGLSPRMVCSALEAASAPASSYRHQTARLCLSYS